MSQDPIIQTLASAGVRGVAGFGEVYRGICPFHDGSASKTFWLHKDSGQWGCWSTRCSKHSGGSLKYLLYCSGLSWSNAELRVKALIGNISETFTGLPDVVRNQADLDNSGAFTKSHLAAWIVDWHLSHQLYRSRNTAGSESFEAQHLSDLSYLFCRGISPEALTLMGVGYDADAGTLIFPLVDLLGTTVGISRRKPAHGESYFISGSPFPKNHPNYAYKRVQRGNCLWGWDKLTRRIEAGDPIVVVEGYADQLTLLGYGMCAVAKLSSRLTANQVEALVATGNPVYLWPDNDAAGLRGVAEDATKFLSVRTIRVVATQGYSDPAETPKLVAQQMVRNALSPIDYLSYLPKLLSEL